MAGKGRSEGMGRWLLAGTIIYCGVIMILSMSRTLWISLPVLVAGGFLGSAFMVGNNAAIQLRIDDRVRGRVMGAYMLTWGLMPLGALPMGIAGQHFGMAPTVFVFAAVAGLLTILLGVSNATLRAL
jgi:MFS family permease